MGGNTTIKTKDNTEISAERVPLDVIGRGNFVKKLQDFVLNLNKAFKSKNGYYIWEDKSEIMNGGIFNGSTSFIMSPDYSDSEIVKYKKSAGDADIAFPREYARDVYNFLEDNEGHEFTKDAMYMGNNASTADRLGNTIICIVKMRFPEAIINVQVDMELSDFVDSEGKTDGKKMKQSDFSAFAHSSSFEDAKAGMKGVAAKHFWRALVGALHQLDSGFVVVTPTSTEDKLKPKGKQPSKIRLLNFGVDSGVGAGYELMKSKIDNKDVYREKKPSEKTYDKNLNNLLQITFNTTAIDVKDTHSFVKTLELANKYLDKNIKQVALDRFLAILYGQDGQAQFIEPEMEEDLKLKAGMYMKAVELLKLKQSKDFNTFVKEYAKKVHHHDLSESFRFYVESLKRENKIV